jgi:hypothetical protein
VYDCGDANRTSAGRLATTSGAAHPPQKSSPGSFENPQDGHAVARGAAHLAQNRRPSRFSA